MNLGDFRSQYPQYNDLSDEDLARGLHQKFYSDMPFDDFASKIGLKTGLIDRAAALFSRTPQPDTTIEDAQAAANAGEGYWTAGKVPGPVKPPEDSTGTAEQVAKAGESGLYRAGSGLLDALWGLAQSSKTDTIARGEGLSMTAADATPMGPALRGMQEAARILFPKDDAGRVQRLEAAKELEAKAEAAAPRLQKTSFDDALDQGEVGSWMLVQAASQSPQYATMLATIFVPALAPVTLPLMGVQAGGNQYAENMKAGVPQDRAALDASINGLIEVASEGLTFAGAKIAAPVFKRIVDSIPDGMKRSIASNLLSRAAAGAGTLGLAGLGEGSSEAIGQVGQDISQREIAGRDPGDMASNARTAFFASLLPGAAFAAPGTAQGVMETPKRREARAAAGLIDAAVSGGEFITPAEEVAISRLSPDRAQLERAPVPAAEFLGEVTPEETISRVMASVSNDPMVDVGAAIREAEAILAAPAPAATTPQTPYGIAPEIPVPPLSPERGYTGERGEVRPDFGLARELQTPAAPEPQPLVMPGESAQPKSLAGPASMAERQLQAEEARQRGELLTQTQIEQAAEFRARPSPEIVVGGTNYGRIEKMPEKQLQALSKLGRGKNRQAALAEIQRRASQPSTPYETTPPAAQERLQQAIAPAAVQQPPSPATTEVPNALQERGAAPLDVRNAPQDGGALAEGNAQVQAPGEEGADRGGPKAQVGEAAAKYVAKPGQSSDLTAVPWGEVDPDRLPPPKITGTGKVVGAPPGNGRVRDRDAIVRRVLKRVALPDAMADKSIDWYEDSGKAIAAVTHGDRALTDRVARLFALYSQGNQVGGNTTATIKSLVQIARGETPAAGRFPNATSAIVNQLLAAPEVSTKVPGVNHKIVNFYRNLIDPALGENRFPDAVTLDRWMMREFGYKVSDQGGEGGSKNLTATQYAYARDVVLRATKAYNQKHGTNIHPRQMQSLIWALHKNETGRAEREQAKRGYKQEVAELGRQAKAGNELAAAELPRAESRLKDAMTPFVPKSLSFADYLKQSTALVTWETVSKRWDSIYPGIRNATPEQLKELTKSSHRILLGPDGNNALLKKVSLVPLFREEFSEGGYAGGVAPNVITGLVLEGGSNPDTKTANLAADLLGYIYHQEAVAWHLPDPNATRAQGRAAGINAVANRAVDGEALEKHLESEVPGVGFTKIGEREYRILNFRGEDGKPFSGLDDKEFGDRIVNALESFKDDVHFDAHDIVARTAYLEGGENGEGYAARIREAGRSDLLQWADDRREVLERVYRDYADRYGWGGSRAGEARGGSAAGEGARAGVTPTVTLRAQQDGAVAAVGVRYGSTKRTSLDGTHYGNGVNGAERARIEGEDNPTVRNTLLNRVYFYEQTDKGSLPKSEDIVTGIQVTRARFTNLYDMSADPLGLWEAGKKRAESGEVARTASGFEMEVIERGFDGYIAKNFGPSPAIVIFTDQSFPVEYLGNRVDAARKLKAEGGNVSEEQGQYEVGERKRSYRKDDRVRRNPPRVQRGIQWRAKGIEEHLVTEGATSLVGRTIENAGDLAELAQVYRNPKYETFRLFFVNDEGVVLNATAVSSRLPGRTGIFPDNLSDDGVFDWMRDQIPDGATGFYMLHNHPSGIPTPSQDDIWATIELSKEARQRFGLRLRAHVVIDHNKYAEIFASGLNSVWDADLEGKDFNAKISEAKQNGGMLGTTLGSPEDVAYAGKLLHRGGLVTLIGHSNVGIQAIADITPEELAHPTRGWAAVRRFARQSGSMSVFAVGEDAQMGPASDNIRSMIREGFLVDAVTLEDDGYYSARAGGVEPRYAGILFGNTPTRAVKGEAPNYDLDFTGSTIPKGGPKGPLNISWQMLDRARRLLGELAKDDESFQFGRSDSRDWNQIVEDMGLKDITGIERIDKRHLAIRTTSMTTDPYLWEPGPPGYEEGQERPRTVYVEMKNEHLRDEDPESTVVPAVEVNSSELKTGGPGKEVYALVSTWAANNGVTFMPDWHGVSMKAVEARVAHGIAAAMRLGTTKFIWPVNPEKRFSGITIRDDSGTRVEQPPKWMYPLYEGWQEVGEPGDAADQHNQRLLIKAQLDIINGKLKKADIVDDVIGKVDNLEGLRYDFRADKIVYEATNEPVPSTTLNRIADALVPPRTKVLRDAGERGVPGEVKERGGPVGAYEPQAGSAPSGGARATAVRGIILQTALNLSPQELDQLSASVLRQPSAEGSPRRGFVSERGPAYDVGGKAPAGEQPLTPSGPVDSLLAKAGGKLAAEKITEPLYQRFLDLGKYVPERVKAGLQSDYGLPEPYIDRRDLMSINQRKGVREAMRSVELLAGLDRAQSRVAYQWMNQREAEGDALLEALPPEEREVLRTLKDTITQLGQEAVELGQLSQESYERNKMAYLHRTYAKFELTDTAQQKLARSRAIRVLGEQYKGRGLRDNVTVDKLPSDVKKGDLFLRLEKRTKVSDREVERGAAPGSMRLRDVKYVRADSQIPAQYEDYTTDGTWEARYMGGEKIGMWRDFTPEERKRMGELDEVKYATAKTLMMMTRDIETGRFLKWVSDTYAKGSDEDLNVVPTPTGRILTSFRADDWVQVPESKIPGTAGLKVYGELAGKYVPAPMWNDIRQAVGERYGYFGDVYNEIVRAWKISKTALSPAVHANNVMANFILADLNDVGARDIAKALKLMVDAQRGDAGAKALLDRYEESGGELGSYAVNELRNRTLEPLLDQLNREVGRADENGALLSAASLVNDLMHGRFREAYEKATQKKAWILGKKAANKMIEAYRAEDEVFRFSLWLKATAQGRSDFESGKLARKAFLDYNINAPWVQNARSTFLPFVAFSYRAGPLIVNSLAHKPWKLLKYFSVAGGLNALAYAMMGMGGGDEDKERKLLPDEKRGKTWVGNPKLMRLPVGMDEKGKLVMPWNAGIKTAAPVFMDVRRWIPMGDFFDVGQSHTAVPIPQSFVFGGPLMVMAEFMLNKQQFTGKPITLETDDKMETAAKVSGHLYKAFAPNLPGLPFTYATTAIGDAAKGATDGFGRQQSVPMAVASSVGLKVGAYPEEVLVKNLAGQKSARLYEVDKQIADARRQLRAEKISEADFEKEIERLTRKKQKIREEFAKKFD